MAASPFAAYGSEALSPTTAQASPTGRRVLRRGGRLGPGPFPARSRAQPGPVLRIP